MSDQCHLAFKRLVHMLHTCSLCQRLQRRKGEPENLVVGLLKEVAIKSSFNVGETQRPSEHTHLGLDVRQQLDIRADPSTP